MIAQTPIKFCYGNAVTPLCTITSGSAATLYPATNVAVDFRGIPWRSTGVASERITIRFPADVTFDFVAILDDNLTTDGTVEVHGSTDQWVADDQVLNGPSVRTGNPTVFFLDTQIFRDIAFVFSDPTNAAGFISVGRIIVGASFQPSRNYNYGWADDTESLSKETTTPNGVPHFDRKTPRIVASGEFEYLSEADKDAINAIKTEVDTVEPFIVVFDPDNHPERARYVRFAALPRLPETLVPRRYNCAMSFKGAL